LAPISRALGELRTRGGRRPFTLKSFLTGLAAAIVAVAGFAAGPPAMAVEEPRYVVSLQDGPFEVRDYPPLLAAETIVEGGRSEAVNAGFRTLARFIFGANRSRQEIAMTAPVIQSRADRGETIAMTAPVIQTPAAGDAYAVQFLMPSGYTAETVPQPTDPNVRIVTVPARRHRPPWPHRRGRRGAFVRLL